jgi:hypothetical protein
MMKKSYYDAPSLLSLADLGYKSTWRRHFCL